MLEKPGLADENIAACLQAEFGLRVAELAFLPLGADLNTAAYRVVADDHTPYFLKLRRQSAFDETSVTLPSVLHHQGLAHIIAPRPTQTGQPCANLDAFKAILYPFVEGRNGYEVSLSDHQWRDLGATLRSLHTANWPPALLRSLHPETYSPQWRESVSKYLELIEQEAWDDPLASDLAAFLSGKHGEILDLIQRADRLAQTLQTQPPEWVVCHADLHAGNLLLGADDALYLVDWDTPILAFKERDLMSIGGGLMGNQRTAEEEIALFYQGYGPTQINQAALAYYRYERIIEDLAVECQQILSTSEGGEDRIQALHYLKSNFLPNQTLAIAYRSDQTQSPSR
jgi:spectinomycin phosphotransferase